MEFFSKEDIKALSKITRLNLINSVTGYKSANLIGSVSKEGKHNVAIFSSVTHLGSDPAMLGFIVRPTTVPRDTYKNCKETGFFSVNAVTKSIIAQAHQTSANYDYGISEFEEVSLEPYLFENLAIPFVKESPIKLLCRYLNEYHIKENDTIHIIAAIEKIWIDDDLMQKDGFVSLEKGNIITINGLDAYCLPKTIDRFEYARPSYKAKSILHNGS